VGVSRKIIGNCAYGGALISLIILRICKIICKKERNMYTRDDLIVIPENKGHGGFICPRCLAVAIGSKWASHAKYCPDCGQHIKISTPEFNKLKELAKTLTPEKREKCCKFYSNIGPDGKYQRMINGIYKKALSDLMSSSEQIEGQMDITDFI
jgi:hypothetical protein